MVDIRKKTEREVQLEDLLRSALSALRDLDRGYPWREIHVNLSDTLAQAKEAGVELEDDYGL